MKKTFSIPKISYGVTSAIMTCMALISGFNSSESSKSAIVAGILVIAFADNISDAFGIHVYQDSERIPDKKAWLLTSTNFVSRIITSFIFLFLVLCLPYPFVFPISFLTGLTMLALMTYYIARQNRDRARILIAEHLILAVLIVAVSRFIGGFIQSLF